jgi:hypothetical protein
MSRKVSHWRDISKPQLQYVLSVLKDAADPLTQGDVRRELERNGLKDKVEAIPTVIWEIGQNPGYKTSGGVRFPDGTYRYWLISAPGWTPVWMITGDFRKVAYTIADCGLRIADSRPVPCTLNPVPCPMNHDPCIPRTCITCGKPIGDDGPPFCDNDGLCKNIHLGIEPVREG